MSQITISRFDQMEPTSTFCCWCREKDERLQFSCFPESADYYFRCRTPKQPLECQPFQERRLPPLETKCCRVVFPRFVEMSLLIDGQMQRIEINLSSFAKRLTIAKGSKVTRNEVYQACAENRLIPFINEIAALGVVKSNHSPTHGVESLAAIDLTGNSSSPAPSRRAERGSWRQPQAGSLSQEADKWRNLLHIAQLRDHVIDSILPFISENLSHWEKECKEKHLDHLYFPAKEGRKLDVEYFADGSILVYYAEEEALLGVDLCGKIINPQVKEIGDLKGFVVYHTCEKLFQDVPGILKIYKTSQDPDENRYRVLHERYKFTLQNYLSGSPGSNSPASSLSRSHSSNSSLNGLSTQGSHRRSRSTLKGKKPLSEKAKVKIAEDWLTGLARLHHAEIVHFCIQPSCLYIDPQKDFRAVGVIGGFDHAWVIDPKLVNTMLSVKMKKQYLAPEIASHPYGQYINIPRFPLACDVYSLGMCLKELFEIEEFPEKIESIGPHLSTEVRIATIIYNMVRREPPEFRLTAEQALSEFTALKKSMNTIKYLEEKLAVHAAFEEKMTT